MKCSRNRECQTLCICNQSLAFRAWSIYFQLLENMATTDFPLYTARHSQHSAVWTVPGFSIHRFCIACAKERRRAGSSREESAQRVSDTPQRHKRERSLCENHHFKRKNYRASQQCAVRSVNVCTAGLVTSHVCSCHMQPVFFHLLGLLSRPDSSVVLLTVRGW